MSFEGCVCFKVKFCFHLFFVKFENLKKFKMNLDLKTESAPKSWNDLIESIKDDPIKAPQDQT